jgi:hypothetical protein
MISFLAGDADHERRQRVRNTVRGLARSLPPPRHPVAERHYFRIDPTVPMSA